MRALSLHQPWASLVALGVKRIETRSWATSYRGPLAIHASRKFPRLHEAQDAWHAFPLEVYEATRSTENRTRFPPEGQHCGPLPLGAVVATATLVDCVPIVEFMADPPVNHITIGWDGRLRSWEVTSVEPRAWRKREPFDVTDQRPYGDFSPGRYAWLLADIKPLAPVPAKGRQGLWEWSA